MFPGRLRFSFPAGCRSGLDVWCKFSEGVPYSSSPAPLEDLSLSRASFDLFPEFSLDGGFRPSGPKDSSEAGVDKSLNLLRRDRLAGIVVKASTSRAEDPRFESRLHWDFFRVESYLDFNMDTPVATLSGAWRYRLRAATGWPGISILLLGEMERLVCNFSLCVTA